MEKPACVYVEEGLKMIQAARKYQRVVQGGTMQRSGGFFRKAREIVKSGELGDITFCRTFQADATRKEGWGNPPDSDPPPGLDWDLWLGPAPARPFNANRFGVSSDHYSTFRYFWDYAGGEMTDWGVHLLDIVQFAFDEAMPLGISAQGGKFYVTDNTETPDTMLVTYRYPGFIGAYESRTANPFPMYNSGYGTAFHGTKATLMVNRDGYTIFKQGPGATPVVENSQELAPMNLPHWQNFLECIRTRQRPTSDIENCVRSTLTCVLANISMRRGLTLAWDDRAMTVRPARSPALSRSPLPRALEAGSLSGGHRLGAPLLPPVPARHRDGAMGEPGLQDRWEDVRRGAPRTWEACLSFKCSPEEFAELVERPGIIPAQYLARAQWIALEREDALPPAEVKRLLRQAYDLVRARLPKKVQAELGAPRAASARPLPARRSR